MLRLTLDIVPLGVEDDVRHIGTLEIARTTRMEDPEDYRVLVFATDGELVNIFTVRQHAYEEGAWVLVSRAVEILTEPWRY